MFEYLSPQLVEMFWKAVGHLEGGISLKHVGLSEGSLKVLY